MTSDEWHVWLELFAPLPLAKQNKQKPKVFSAYEGLVSVILKKFNVS